MEKRNNPWWEDGAQVGALLLLFAFVIVVSILALR